MSDLRIERIFDAPVKKVFSFVSQTEHLVKWWGPETVKVVEHNLQLTSLGPWSAVMENDEGGRYKVTGEVISIDPPNHVEFSFGWHDEDDVRGNNTTVRFELATQDDGKTAFTLIHTGLADDEIARNHNSGWTSSLIKLERIAKNT